MNNTIEYKGYVGSVEFSEEDGLFFGKVMGIRALISYEGRDAKELISDMLAAFYLWILVFPRAFSNQMETFRWTK